MFKFPVTLFCFGATLSCAQGSHLGKSLGSNTGQLYARQFPYLQYYFSGLQLCLSMKRSRSDCLCIYASSVHDIDAFFPSRFADWCLHIRWQCSNIPYCGSPEIVLFALAAGIPKGSASWIVLGIWGNSGIELLGFIPLYSVCSPWAWVFLKSVVRKVCFTFASPTLPST